MAVIKRQWRTWLAAVAVLAGVFLLWDRKTFGHTPANETILVATTFASLDGGVHDADGAVNGSVTIDGDLTIANGGSITCDEVGTPASACPITLIVTGDLLIQAGGSIHADNVGNNGGTGGDITITVGGDFTMDGPGGGNPGAFISSQQAGGGNGQGGDILILVGGVTLDTSADPAIGVCESKVLFGVPIAANTGDALIASGATITSDAASGRAGDIALYAGRNIAVHGTVRAEGFEGAGHGGAITLDACCDLLIGNTGLVRSAGRDPGPDRVHVEGCVVTIYGVVESTGPAHQNPEPNCNAPERPGKPLDGIYTACVEIWSGTTILIDSTDGHFGQVNADTAMSGGISGRGWIDILANGQITINDGTNDDHVQPLGGGGSVPVVHIVHANQYLGNGNGGDILVQSKAGGVSTFGNAIQANDDSNGGGGGTVTVEAGGAGSPAGDVSFDSASIQARGANGGGGTQNGGTIRGRSFNGDLSGTGGELNADGGGGGGTAGSVTLEACLGATYTGTSTPPFVLGPNDLVCGGMPTFPVPANTLLPAATCLTECSPATPTPTNTPTDTATNTPTRTATPTVTPTPGIFCNKLPVQTVLAGRVPDVIVRTDLGQSIQNAVTGASDTNGDNFIIVGVVNNGTGTLGGHVSQRVTVSLVYPKPFLLIGCSVTLHDPNRGDGLPTGLITAGAGSPGNIFIMDLHGADSEVAGWKVEGNGRYVRNTVGSGSPVGLWFLGNGNTMHNGAATGNGVGILVEGDGNLVTDADAFSNTSHGVQVVGNTNRLLKIDAGDIGKGNGGDGFNVSGNTNLLTENKARDNTLDGIRIVAGTGNRLKKNLSGGTVSQNNDDCEFEVVAGNVNDGENKANNVTVPGAVGSAFPTGCIGSP